MKEIEINILKYLAIICVFFLASSILLPASILHAQEITIFYTGETHAMLYPCSCPKERDGGVARRASLLKQLRQDCPDSFLLDAGGFFAGGLMDEYTQNDKLDKQRTQLNLQAIKLMKYDALAVGFDEFNFGKEFLQDGIKDIDLPFLSCNLELRGITPYILKEVQGVKIGITAVTPASLRTKGKIQGAKFIEPNASLEQAIKDLRDKGAVIILVLGQLTDSEGADLVNNVEGIDVLISGYVFQENDQAVKKVGTSLIAKSFWQGRRVCKLSLSVENDKVVDYKFEQLRVSDEFPDDPDINSILPECFSDANCKKKGLIGSCNNPAAMNSRCKYNKPEKVSLLIVTPKLCRVCDSERVVKYLNKQFMGLEVSYVYYPGSKAKKLIREHKIHSLPAYLLGKEIAKEKNFPKLQENFQAGKDYYLLKTKISGMAYFVNRKKIKDKLDLFISLYDENTKSLLQAIEEFNPAIHFLVSEKDGEFDAANGNIEVEECLRAVCVEKHYPQYFRDYIGCRVDNIASSWWDDCVSEIEPGRIKSCATSDEGRQLLRDNINLNKELEIMFGPTYLMDNQEIFSSRGTPSKEELRKIFMRR